MMKLLRLPEVLERRGRKRTSHYNDIEAGLFTKPVRIGERATAWPDYEVERLQEAVVKGLTPEGLRALVEELHAQRKA